MENPLFRSPWFEMKCKYSATLVDVSILSAWEEYRHAATRGEDATEPVYKTVHAIFWIYCVLFIRTGREMLF